MLERKRWKDLKGAAAYDVGRSVLVSTTDLRRSNSGAMYLALTSAMCCRVTWSPTTPRRRRRRSSWPSSSSARVTRKTTSTATSTTTWPSASARRPMAFIYENQLVKLCARPRSGVGADMVLMYPRPTIVNKVVFVVAERTCQGAGRRCWPATPNCRAWRWNTASASPTPTSFVAAAQAHRAGGRAARDPGGRPAFVRDHGRDDRRGGQGDERNEEVRWRWIVPTLAALLLAACSKQEEPPPPPPPAGGWPMRPTSPCWPPATCATSQPLAEMVQKATGVKLKLPLRRHHGKHRGGADGPGQRRRRLVRQRQVPAVQPARARAA